MKKTPFRLDIPRAIHAARTLAANPDDLPQVFTLIESFSMDTLTRIVRRLEKSENGRALLAKQPDVVDLLVDRAALAQLPAGSLGRAYLDFVESENISAEGIRAACAEGESDELPEPFGYVHRRMRDTHDLWHAVTGYRGDVLGEVALLGFLLAQTHNPGVLLMVSIGLAKMRHLPDARRLIVDGFRRGRRAAWLPEQPWESMLHLPVAEVRARLGIDALPVYEPMRTAELRVRLAA